MTGPAVRWDQELAALVERHADGRELIRACAHPKFYLTRWGWYAARHPDVPCCAVRALVGRPVEELAAGASRPGTRGTR